MKGTNPTAATEPVKNFTVRLDPTARPGVKACGSYVVGQPYTVDAAEAHRLVAFKGFDFVDPADRDRCAAELKRRETEANTAAHAA